MNLKGCDNGAMVGGDHGKDAMIDQCPVNWREDVIDRAIGRLGRKGVGSLPFAGKLPALAEKFQWIRIGFCVEVSCTDGGRLAKRLEKEAGLQGVIGEIVRIVVQRRQSNFLACDLHRADQRASIVLCHPERLASGQIDVRHSAQGAPGQNRIAASDAVKGQSNIVVLSEGPAVHLGFIREIGNLIDGTGSTVANGFGKKYEVRRFPLNDRCHRVQARADIGGLEKLTAALVHESLGDIVCEDLDFVADLNLFCR